METTVKDPWMNEYCDKCSNNTHGDMCRKITLGMSYGYCPSIKECNCYKEKKKK